MPHLSSPLTPVQRTIISKRNTWTARWRLRQGGITTATKRIALFGSLSRWSTRHSKCLLGSGEIPFSLLDNAPLLKDQPEVSSNQASSSRDVESLPDIPAWLIYFRNWKLELGDAAKTVEQACLVKFHYNPDCQFRSFVIHDIAHNWFLSQLDSAEEISEYAITAFALIGSVLYDGQSGLLFSAYTEIHCSTYSDTTNGLF